ETPAASSVIEWPSFTADPDRTPAIAIAPRDEVQQTEDAWPTWSAEPKATTTEPEEPEAPPDEPEPIIAAPQPPPTKRRNPTLLELLRSTRSEPAAPLPDEPETTPEYAEAETAPEELVAADFAPEPQSTVEDFTPPPDSIVDDSQAERP